MGTSCPPASRNTSGCTGGYGGTTALLATPTVMATVVQQGTAPLMPVMGNATGAAASWSGGGVMESCCASPVVRGDAATWRVGWPRCVIHAWSPCSRKPQQPSFRLLQDQHWHVLQIVNDIETNRFIYIDTSMVTLKLTNKYH
jgi:hypothetical protein